MMKLFWVVGRPGPQFSTSKLPSEITSCSEAFRPTWSSSESTEYLQDSNSRVCEKKPCQLQYNHNQAYMVITLVQKMTMVQTRIIIQIINSSLQKMCEKRINDQNIALTQTSDGKQVMTRKVVLMAMVTCCGGGRCFISFYTGSGEPFSSQQASTTSTLPRLVAQLNNTLHRPLYCFNQRNLARRCKDAVSNNPIL